MNPVKKVLMLSLFVIAVLAAGCTNQSPALPVATEPAKQQETQAAPNGTAAKSLLPGQEAMQLTIYYATGDARYVMPEVHTVAKNDHPAQTAIELLIAGPKNTQLVSVVPKETKLKNIWVKDHIAYVDFNDKLVTGGQGGSALELLLTAAIANTLTEFPDIKKVQILVEGQKVTTLSGHLDVSEPVGRVDKMIKKQ